MAPCFRCKDGNQTVEDRDLMLYSGSSDISYHIRGVVTYQPSTFGENIFWLSTIDLGPGTSRFCTTLLAWAGLVYRAGSQDFASDIAGSYLYHYVKSSPTLRIRSIEKIAAGGWGLIAVPLLGWTKIVNQTTVDHNSAR